MYHYKKWIFQKNIDMTSKDNETTYLLFQETFQVSHQSRYCVLHVARQALIFKYIALCTRKSVLGKVPSKKFVLGI